MKHLFVALAVAVLLASCAQAPTSAPAAPTTAPPVPTSVASVPTTAPSTAAPSTGKQLTFYWMGGGSTGDPIWVFALQGAQEAGKALGVKVNAALFASDTAAQKEAVDSAIAAGADGIATSLPQTGIWNDDIKLAHSKGIPFVIVNSDDPTSGRDAYVGGDLQAVGVAWAQYLVAQKLVKQGDTVWMPFEAPGAAYQVLETQGAASVFDPLGIKHVVFDAGTDPTKELSNMVDYLTAHRSTTNAVIAGGDIVAAEVQPAFEQVGIPAGSIPVVGWGNALATANSVKAGYVNAATWQYPDAQGYMAIFMLYEAKMGRAIGYSVLTTASYDKTNVDQYLSVLTAMQKK